MIRQRIHTGCKCKLCRKGRTKLVRRIFHKSVRYRLKIELQKVGELININSSIGYTD